MNRMNRRWEDGHDVVEIVAHPTWAHAPAVPPTFGAGGGAGVALGGQHRFYVSRDTTLSQLQKSLESRYGRLLQVLSREREERERERERERVRERERGSHGSWL